MAVGWGCPTGTVGGGVGVAVGVGTGVAVGVEVGTGVAVGIGVGVGTGVAVGVEVGTGVGVGAGVAVGAGVGVGVAVGAGAAPVGRVGVGVAGAVEVIEGVDTTVGSRVGVGVGPSPSPCGSGALMVMAPSTGVMVRGCGGMDASLAVTFEKVRAVASPGLPTRSKVISAMWIELTPDAAVPAKIILILPELLGKVFGFDWKKDPAGKVPGVILATDTTEASYEISNCSPAISSAPSALTLIITCSPSLPMAPGRPMFTSSIRKVMLDPWPGGLA